MTDNDILQRNNVRISGQGIRTLMFAHGFGCDQSMWRLMAPAFEQTHRVVLFDYVGAGQSDRQAYDRVRYNSLDGYARDVLEICEALYLRDVAFVGHSVSAMIGMLASMAAPGRIAQLVMVAPSPCYINHPPDYVGGFDRADIVGLLSMMDNNGFDWAGFLAPSVMKNSDRPELADELQASFCRTDPLIVRQFAEVTFYTDLREQLPECATPSLILQCADDSIAPSSVGEYMARHLPHAELAMMTATGHCPHVSHPDETIALTRRYLAAH
jgi:sigma-B regulation protein RsbQ